MNSQGIFREKAYAWLIVLLVFEVAILLYAAMFMPQGLDRARRQDASRTLTHILNSINTSKSPAETAAAAASFQLVCEQESYSKAISAIRPAVVFIEVRFSQNTSVARIATGGFVFDSAQAAPARRIGSGVIVDRKGYILTNYHVIANAVDIDVTPFASTRQKFKASIVRYSERDDLALLTIDTGYNLPEATLGDSDTAEVGDVVLAIGSPFGMEHTATLGIISDENRSLVIDGHLYSRMLQTDAAINRGNSGGALVTVDGEVIGINTAIFAPTGVFTGVGFAIPINAAKPMLAKSALVQPKAAGL